MSLIIMETAEGLGFLNMRESESLFCGLVSGKACFGDFWDFRGTFFKGLKAYSQTLHGLGHRLICKRTITLLPDFFLKKNKK